jgi:hypothetical protein
MGKRICTIEGCVRKEIARGWCPAHYQRWRLHGDPLGLAPPRPSQSERFWSKVDRDGPIPADAPHLGQCWLFLGTVGKPGYGYFDVSRRRFQAHRWGYVDAGGYIPQGLDLDHLCFVRNCVNPSHLEPVTHRENVLRSRTNPSAVNARRTHCVRGHPFDEPNTIIKVSRRGIPHRICRECGRIANRALYHRQKAERLASLAIEREAS